MTPIRLPDDSDLVSESLSGNRDAFGQIVSRYQSLVCSLAYSATGSLSQSEDLAQDTFITAWKQLRELREPGKLRAWICGIARNLINNSLRREGREPSHRAEPLEEFSGSPSPEPLPVEKAISKEEAEILWRALERIPEIYREPLILFYREHQSIETVAANLELSEDNVKQRLSRGRKLLQEQFLAFVEGALAQTTPGASFTLSVLSALPAIGLSAKAATLGTVAAKGGAAAKDLGVMGMLGAILSPVLAVAANYASYRMSMNEADTDEERFHVKRLFQSSLLISLVLSAVVAVPFVWLAWGEANGWEVTGLLFGLFISLYFLVLVGFVITTMPQRRRYLAASLQGRYGGNFPPTAFEYRSRATLFGWPLIHVRIGDRFDVIRGPVKAWIAIGSSHAIGLLFASGGVAIAPLSFGAIAIGLVPFGAIAFGVWSLGAISIGVWAYGAVVVGWQVFGACGIAWHAAAGAVVAARDFAIGSFVRAEEANSQIAQQFFQQNFFFRISQWMSNHGFLVMLAWVIPVSLQARVIARARRRRESAVA